MVGYWVDCSPRFFKIIGYTPQKVRLIRIKCNKDYISALTTNGEIHNPFLAIVKKYDNEYNLYGNGFKLFKYESGTDASSRKW